MNALGKTWHPGHFLCTLCGKHFGDEGFMRRMGRPTVGKTTTRNLPPCAIAARGPSWRASNSLLPCAIHMASRVLQLSSELLYS